MVFAFLYFWRIDTGLLSGPVAPALDVEGSFTLLCRTDITASVSMSSSLFSWRSVSVRTSLLSSWSFISRNFDTVVSLRLCGVTSCWVLCVLLWWSHPVLPGLSIFFHPGGAQSLLFHFVIVVNWLGVDIISYWSRETSFGNAWMLPPLQYHS